MSKQDLVEHFFRHEYGRLVSIFARKVGAQHVELIEDSVQSALMKALESWSISGAPQNPTAWVYKVAHNNLAGELRQRASRDRILEKSVEDLTGVSELHLEFSFPKEIEDNLLRMIFVCCDSSIPTESQLVLALKTLCGFSVGEIALCLFINESNVYKRLGRARAQLRKSTVNDMELAPKEYSSRLTAVNKTLYLLFTEGYFSSDNEEPIRRELCNEAIRLVTLLAKHPLGQTPETFALLALMHLHVARMGARKDRAGSLLLLEEQDRSLWDQDVIKLGIQWLERSAQGDIFTRYHAEAGIAAEHCLAPSFDQTRWGEIVENYLLLERVSPSAIHRLNRAVAVAEWQGPVAGLTVLKGFEPPQWLVNSYLFNAVLSDLYQRSGNFSEAKSHHDKANRLAPSSAVKRLLQRRMNRMLRDGIMNCSI